MTLVDRSHIPPGGWRYTQKETGMEIRGGDFFHLCEKVRHHRQLNKLHTGNLAEDVETQLCQKLDERARKQFCRSDSVKAQPVRRVDFGDVKHFLQTLANLKTFVPQAEAIRRAKICSECSFNYSIAGCTRCRNLPALLFKVIGKRATPFDKNLGGCGVCGCSLQASVHVPLEAFPTEPKYEYPDWCWHHP